MTTTTVDRHPAEVDINDCRRTLQEAWRHLADMTERELDARRTLRLEEDTLTELRHVLETDITAQFTTSGSKVVWRRPNPDWDTWNARAFTSAVIDGVDDHEPEPEPEKTIEQTVTAAERDRIISNYVTSRDDYLDQQAAHNEALRYYEHAKMAVGLARDRFLVARADLAAAIAVHTAMTATPEGVDLW